MNTPAMRLLASLVLACQASIAAASGPVVIDFEDLQPAPDLFQDTTPLTDRYEELGVVFAGVGLDGGAILDANAAGFFIEGYSGENILAFNAAAEEMANGGIASLPETLLFDPPVQWVKMLAANPDDFFVTQIRVDAYDISDELLDSDEIAATNEMQELVVAAPGIAKVVITSDGEAAAIDDVSFLPAGEFYCGDANFDAGITAADALLTLKTAVGTGNCGLQSCDVNGDFKVSAADALLVLRSAVGLVTTLECPEAA